jgi:hypothetical protein
LRRTMDNFGHLAQHVVRGVYFSGGSGCSVGQRAMPDLAASRRWRSGGQVRAVSPCRRQSRRGDLDRSEDGAIIGASPGHWDGGRQRNVSGGSRPHVGRNANAIARSGPASREGAPRQSTLRCSSASKGRTAARCWIRPRGEVCCSRLGAAESAEFACEQKSGWVPSLMWRRGVASVLCCAGPGRSRPSRPRATLAGGAPPRPGRGATIR